MHVLKNMYMRKWLQGYWYK